MNSQKRLQPVGIIKQNVLSDKINFSRNLGVVVFKILHKYFQIMTMNKSKLAMIEYCLWVFLCISANHDNPSLGWVGDGQAQTNTIYKMSWHAI